MGTTDTIRAAFEAAYLSANGFHTKAELANEWKDGMLSSHMFRAGYQAATEAAKATSVAVGELPPLPSTTLTAEVAGYKVPAFGAQHMRDFAMAALASPADALVAGDRVDAITDTQRMDFQQANPHMYFNVDKRGKRWRFGHFSNYPQDCYGSAREALDAAIQAQKDGHG